MKINILNKKGGIEVGKSDVILDNGSCYILLTQKVRRGYNEYSPSISKSQFNKLIKGGYIKLSEKKYRPHYGCPMDLYEFTELAEREVEA